MTFVSKAARTATTLLIAVGMAFTAYADGLKINHFVKAPDVDVRQPMMIDTLNPHGKKYDAAALIDGVNTADLVGVELVALEADTAGIVALERPAEGMRVVTLRARLRPERFVKGKLRLTTPAIADMLVDGKSVSKKTTADDSISASSTISAPLTMLPQAESIVTVKLLVDADAKADPTVELAYEPANNFEDVAINVAEPGTLRRFEMRDTALGCRVTGVSISPDGKYMIVKYWQRFAKDNDRQFAQLIDLKSGRVINNNFPTSLRWMPRGLRLYRTARGEKGYDVYAVSLPTMEETLLMSGVPQRDFTWSPTEDYVLYETTDAGVANPGPLRRYLSPDDRIEGSRSRSFLNIYHPATGTSEQLVWGNRQTSLSDVSPDGKKLLLITEKNVPTEWPFYFRDLVELDLATMTTDTIALRDPNINKAIYSPDGKSLFIVGSPMAFNNIGFKAQPHEIANSYDGQGFIMDLATRNVRPMTIDLDPAIDGAVTWNPADNLIYITTEDGFSNLIYTIDPRSGKIEKVPHNIDYIQGFSIGDENAQWFAYYGQGNAYSGRAWLLNRKTGKQTLIADPWAETADKIAWGEAEPWTFMASDSTMIDGYITYPPEFDPSKKYPLIVYYYGGTSPTKHNTYSPYNPQLYASRGYVVFQLNPSGTTGYGQEFSARHINAWGKRTADDIIEGVKLFCEAHPFIDASKIGCMGASYGGFMTEYLQTLTDIFAAAISHAGISNVTSYWGEGYWGYSYNALAAAKSYPWSDPELFTRQGALFNADKIHTPLLLLHGTVDTNVPIGESIQLFNALKILDRPVELVTVDGENHHVLDYDRKIKWQNTMMAWWAKWLQDDPRWWDELYPTTD